MPEPDLRVEMPEPPGGDGPEPSWPVPGADLSISAVAPERLPGAMSKLEAIGEMALCSGLPTQLAITWLLRLMGVSPVDADGQLVLGFVAALSLLDTAVMLGLMVWLLRSRGERPSNVWLGARRVGGEVLMGILYVPAVFLIEVALLLTMRALTPQLHNVDVNPFQTLAGHSLKDAALLIAVAIAAGGFREELQRAFLLHRFERNLGPAWVGVVLLSVAFGLGHLLQGQDAAVATGALGAFWAVIYLRRRSCVAPLVSHAVFDSLQVMQIVALTR